MSKNFTGSVLHRKHFTYGLNTTHLQSPTERLLTRSPFFWRYFVKVPLYRTEISPPVLSFESSLNSGHFVVQKISFGQAELDRIASRKWNNQMKQSSLLGIPTDDLQNRSYKTKRTFQFKLFGSCTAFNSLSTCHWQVVPAAFSNKVLCQRFYNTPHEISYPLSY